MPYETYKLLHLVGLVTLFLGLGGILAHGGKSFSLLHGVGLVLLLVAGFGMQAKGNLGFPGWMIAKIGIWVVIAVIPVFVKRKALPLTVAALAVIALAGTSAWLAIAKPF